LTGKKGATTMPVFRIDRGPGHFLRLTAKTPRELFDLMMRSRSRNRNRTILGYLKEGGFGVLAVIDPPGSPEAIDAACGEAFARCYDGAGG
jgi:hypothetical protein